MHTLSGVMSVCIPARFPRTLLCALLMCGGAASLARAQTNYGALRTWGLETYAEINRSLQVPGTQLFAETASLSGTQSGGFNGRSFIWPASTQFRVLDTLTQIDPTTYSSTLRQFSDQLRTSYWNAGYRSGAGGGDRFYDDNAHMVVALMDAYRATNQSVYLNRARETQAFVMSGEDTVAGGGIYFKQNDDSTKDVISTLQGARGAAMLYRATKQQSYLNDATRLLTWAQKYLQSADGLFSQSWNIANNSPQGVELVNSAGIGISANLELYDATANSTYLAEAERIAGRTLTRYFDSSTGQINDEGYWAFELVDALDNLYLHDKNALWRDKVSGALVWLHGNKRDPNGHYGVFWGREGPQVGPLGTWNLNEQASVAEAYLNTSTIPEPSSVLLLLAGAVSVALGRKIARTKGET